MRTLFVAFIMLGAVASSADDLGALEAAARRYVASMKAVLALPEAPDCSETIAKAGEYAAAKLNYYDAARKAMPALLQMAKGEKTGSHFGEDLMKIFRGFGEDADQEATVTLESKLNRCPETAKRSEAHKAVEQARQAAEQFIKDLGRLEGA